MKELAGYIDITPGDFKNLYLSTFRHALERINNFAQAEDIMTRQVVAVARKTTLHETALTMLVGSFGASVVLIYGAVRSPPAQPRNLIGGHIISAVIGVTCYKLFPSQLWLASSLAVATSIAVMHATKTLHPPGGATSLIAVIGGKKIHQLGYLYVLMPAGDGAMIMLAVALLVNNLPSTRKYSEFWL
jgi:CBS-domain-containing membrane protein